MEARFFLENVSGKSNSFHIFPPVLSVTFWILVPNIGYLNFPSFSLHFPHYVFSVQTFRVLGGKIIWMLYILRWWNKKRAKMKPRYCPWAAWHQANGFALFTLTEASNFSDNSHRWPILLWSHDHRKLHIKKQDLNNNHLSFDLTSVSEINCLLPLKYNQLI